MCQSKGHTLAVPKIAFSAWSAERFWPLRHPHLAVSSTGRASVTMQLERENIKDSCSVDFEKQPLRLCFANPPLLSGEACWRTRHNLPLQFTMRLAFATSPSTFGCHLSLRETGTPLSLWDISPDRGNLLSREAFFRTRQAVSLLNHSMGGIWPSASRSLTRPFYV